MLESIAWAAVELGNWDRALRVAGAAARIRQRFRFPLTASAKANLDRRREPAHRSMTASAAAAAWMEGWSMPLEKALEYAFVGETE